MNILDAMTGAQNPSATVELARQFGLRDDQVRSALSALVPALSAGFQRHMSSPQGLEGLLSALASGQHQQYIDDPGALSRPETTADGNGILAHVFGSKELSRQVASRAASQTGIGESVLKSMLPVVAAMMMGAMSRQSHQTSPMQAAPGGDLLSMLTPMLDANRSGSAVDDIAGMIGRFFSR